jgi:hypothetical protein
LNQQTNINKHQQNTTTPDHASHRTGVQLVAACFFFFFFFFSKLFFFFYLIAQIWRDGCSSSYSALLCGGPGPDFFK